MHGLHDGGSWASNVQAHERVGLACGVELAAGAENQSRFVRKEGVKGARGQQAEALYEQTAVEPRQVGSLDRQGSDADIAGRDGARMDPPGCLVDGPALLGSAICLLGLGDDFSKRGQ